MTFGAEACLDLAINLDLRCTVASVPGDLSCADHRGQFGNDPECRASAQHKRDAQPFQIAGKGGQRPVEPPATCAPQRSKAGRNLIKHEDRQHRSASRDGQIERRIVAHAQIVTKPDEGRLFGVCHVGHVRQPGPERSMTYRRGWLPDAVLMMQACGKRPTPGCKRTLRHHWRTRAVELTALAPDPDDFDICSEVCPAGMQMSETDQWVVDQDQSDTR